MEKIFALALEILDHLKELPTHPTTQTVAAKVSAIVDEAKGLSDAFALAVASAGGKLDATSPAASAESGAGAGDAAPTADAGSVTEAAPVALHPIYGTPI